MLFSFFKVWWSRILGTMKHTFFFRAKVTVQSGIQATIQMVCRQTDGGQTDIQEMLVYMFGTWLRTGWWDSRWWRWGVPPGEGTPDVEAERPSLHADFESAKYICIHRYVCICKYTQKISSEDIKASGCVNLSEVWIESGSIWTTTQIYNKHNHTYWISMDINISWLILSHRGLNQDVIARAW